MRESLLVVILVATVLAVLVDLVTIFILCRFRRIRKQYYNVYILQISIVNIINSVFVIVLIIMDIKLIVTYYGDTALDWRNRWAKMFNDIILSLLFTQFLSITIMNIDWFVNTFFSLKCLKFEKYVCTIITIISYMYITTIFLYLFFSNLWNYQSQFPAGVFLLGQVFLSFIICLIFKIIYLVYRKRLRKPNSAVLNVSLLKTSLWLFLILFNIHFQSISLAINGFVWVVLILSPLIQLLAFNFWDRSYKAALSQFSNCSKLFSVEDAENIENSLDEEVVTYYNNSNVEVAD